MSVIKFEPDSANFLIHENKRFFLASFDNKPFLVTDNCPHRGGPLHLGSLDCGLEAIVCPWHDSAVSIELLKKLAVPLIWRRDEAVAILPQADEPTSIVFKSCPLPMAS